MIRWGILGAGKIAHRFARSLRQEPDSRLVAISCRTREKAEAFGQEFDVPRRYTDHEALLRDAEVDAIYLALPHGLHCEWAVRALRAGKAVLCEKPATLSAEEMRAVAAAARESGRLFMEAMKPRFVPAHAAVRRLLDEGAVGQLVRVETSLCNAMQDSIQATYHTQPGQGGALLDCGIYCASWLEETTTGPFESEALERIAAKRLDEATGVDLYTDAYFRAGGITLRLECAFDRQKPREVVLVGTQGRIVVEELHRPQAFTLLRDGCEPVRVECPYEVDDFYGEIHHFVQCLQEGRTESPRMPLDASIRCAEILDCIRAGLRREGQAGEAAASCARDML
jgi:predicted dehydrogenase